MYRHTAILLVSTLLGASLAACGGGRDRDLDGDGHGALVDCDDSDPSIYPDAPEVCDGVDNNCDGAVDEPTPDATLWYADSDGDGYGDPEATQRACEQPEGYVSEGGDCDDSSVQFHPGATEDDCTDPNDYNCDGSTGYADADGDGVAACEDCDDSAAGSYPGADEICDTVDNDCDDAIDEDAIDPGTWYADRDGDGFGSDETVVACEQPDGYVADGGDCNDADTLRHPGAQEVCDDIDNDCNGETDDDPLDGYIYYPDVDGDGYGDDDASVVACSQPEEHIANGGDCDDSDAAISPDAVEVCDQVDNDCDGTIDGENATDAPTWYADIDGDTYGDPNASTRACQQPSDYSPNDRDCNDDDHAINPGVVEVCNDGVDNDCDGTDNGCSLVGRISLAAADVSGVGADGGGNYGRAIAHAGDVNGDGFADLLVGADTSGSSGAAYLFFGPVGTSNLDAANANATLFGEAPDDRFGWALAGGGDINGDGYDDIVVGAYKNDAAGGDAGAVYVFYGPITPGSINAASADAVLTGEFPGDMAGHGVDIAGDVNGDGHDDLIIGAPRAKPFGGEQSGVSYVVHGPVSGTLSLSQAVAKINGPETYYAPYTGAAVAGAGDVDGDGHDDILIGSTLGGKQRKGWTAMFLSPISGTVPLTSGDTVFEKGKWDNYGFSVSGGGDINGDGFADMVVGRVPSNYYGYCWNEVWTGSATGDVTVHAFFLGCSLYQQTSVAIVGDVNSDGYDDFLMSNNQRSETYLMLGPTVTGDVRKGSATATFVGESSSDTAGWGLARGSADYNGDGVADIVIGAPRYTASDGTQVGKVYLFLGGGL